MTSDIRLLVRADDAGSSWSSNIGCLQACTDGIARSVEVMMPGPWVAHAAHLFNARPEIDIGIHLTLTSEWDAIKWRPLTHAPSLVDDNGYFLPLLTPRKGDGRASLQTATWTLDEIATELSAQITLGTQMFPQASHISTHMIRHLRDFDPKLAEVIADLCAAHGLMDDPFGHGLPRMAGYSPFPRDAQSRTQAFIAQLDTLAPGTHIFVDHPATAAPELHATGHPGYEDVAADRISCLEVLTNADVKAAIAARDITLISYADLSSHLS